tara:strand:+ start:719 stop:913 length:195 start_codon:yes stop_codon:yes gene_type:complete
MSRRSKDYYKDPNRKGNEMQFTEVSPKSLGRRRKQVFDETLKETGDTFLSLVKTLEITSKTSKK